MSSTWSEVVKYFTGLNRFIGPNELSKLVSKEDLLEFAGLYGFEIDNKPYYTATDIARLIYNYAKTKSWNDIIAWLSGIDYYIEPEDVYLYIPKDELLKYARNELGLLSLDDSFSAEYIAKAIFNVVPHENIVPFPENLSGLLEKRVKDHWIGTLYNIGDGYEYIKPEDVHKFIPKHELLKHARNVGLMGLNERDTSIKIAREIYKDIIREESYKLYEDRMALKTKSSLKYNDISSDESSDDEELMDMLEKTTIDPNKRFKY